MYWTGGYHGGLLGGPFGGPFEGVEKTPPDGGVPGGVLTQGGVLARICPDPKKCPHLSRLGELLNTLENVPPPPARPPAPPVPGGSYRPIYLTPRKGGYLPPLSSVVRRFWGSKKGPKMAPF